MRMLLAIAVGPVQDFIAAARKTRDLWFGSKILSDISRVVALKLADTAGGTEHLIFPAPESRGQLEDAEFNVANVIVAELPGELAGSIDSDVLKPAREAACQRWRDYAEQARGNIKKTLKERFERSFHQDLWDAQVDDVVEFYAAWVPFDENQDYQQTRRRLMQLLAGRKHCRDFLPAKSRAGIPKSSLDGARESVLVPDTAQGLRNRLRLRERESLDCIGLTKRLALAGAKGEAEPHFPSVSRVAAEPWLRGAAALALRDDALKQSFEALGTEAGKLVSEGLVHRVPGYTDFRYEGVVVYRNRYREFETELGERDTLTQKTLKLREAVLAIEKTIGAPDPYVAMLIADGDQVGRALSELDKLEKHRDFSTALAGFAQDARRIVEQENFGVLVYSGGDDVLAMVPVDTCVRCARTLHDTFGQIMDRAAQALKEELRPTLSVGIAIGHFMEPLEFLREFAQVAEQDAKRGAPERVPDTARRADGTPSRSEGTPPHPDTPRNGLAVHVHSRGGAPVTCRARWDAPEGGSDGSLPLDERLHAWVQLLLDDALPHRAAYELRRLSADFENWAERGDDAKQRLKRAIQAAALRSLKRKQAAGGADVAVARISDLLKDVTCAADLNQLASELLIARRLFLAAKLAQPRALRQMNEEAEESVV